MGKEILQSKTVSELRELAKKLNISGRWDMKKSTLIEAILEAEKIGKTTNESAKDEIKIDNHKKAKDVAVENKFEKKSTGVEINMTEKMSYIEGAEIGTLVAFRLSNGKVKSAKIVKKSTSKKRFKLETNYGASYIVPFDSIIWVRTGKRWPKGVYELLKGIERDGKQTS